MKNPFNRHVFPTIARRLSAYLKDGQHLAIPVDTSGHPISPRPDEIRIAGLNDKEREVVAAILAHAALRLHEGEWRNAYDWDAATVYVAQQLGCKEEFDVTKLVEEGCALGFIATYPGAAEALKALTESGVKLVAMSNGFTCYQKPVLEALQLYKYFTAVVSPEETGYAKPDPRLFKAAYAAAGVPEDTMAFHVGDSLVCDVGGALAAGMRAVWVRRELPEEAQAVAPEDRVSLPILQQHLADAAAQEFCGSLYGFTPSQLLPDVVVMSMDEVSDTVLRISSRAESTVHPANMAG